MQNTCKIYLLKGSMYKNSASLGWTIQWQHNYIPKCILISKTDSCIFFINIISFELKFHLKYQQVLEVQHLHAYNFLFVHALTKTLT